MTHLGYRETDVRDNVGHVLQANGLRGSAELMRTGLGYILTATPSNFIDVYKDRLVAEEQHALSVLCLAIDASLDGEQPLVDVRARLDDVRKKLVEVHG